MESRVEAEMHEIKRSLEKCMAESEHDEQIFDELCALERVQVTPKVIKDTKMGNTLAAIRGKFKASNGKIADKAAALMAAWKKIMEASMQKGDGHGTEGQKETKKESHHKPPIANFVSPSSSSVSGNAHMDKAAVESKLNGLSSARKLVYNILLTTFTDTTPRDVASAVALSIEEALNKQMSAESMLKAYTNKAKSLAFNLKKNDVGAPLPRTSHLSSFTRCVDIVGFASTRGVWHDSLFRPGVSVGRRPRLPRAEAS
jgi:hypothetical protein